MNDVRNLSLRKQPPRERSSRAGRDGRPQPDDPGEIGGDYKLHNMKTDRQFQERMLQAIQRRLESIPLEVNTATRDSVPMRRSVPGQVFTASNLEN